MMLSEHTYKQFDTELEAVRASVLKMGGLVEEQITNAVEALISGNMELADQVDANDHNVNALEVAIDEDCTHIIARRQPTASDLRMVMMIVKTITDLERIGDESEKIGFLASKLAGMDRPTGSYVELKNLGHHVLQMVRDTMNAFARLDVAACKSIMLEDDRVDDEYDAITRQCITFMMEDPHSVQRVMNVTWAARALERIGDHAKNICEYVVYMVEGRDIRHTRHTKDEQ